MNTLFPPYRTPSRFAAAAPPGPAVPVPWAVRTPSLRAARDLLAQLRQVQMQAGEIVVARDGRIYVRWAD